MKNVITVGILMFLLGCGGVGKTRPAMINSESIMQTARVWIAPAGDCSQPHKSFTVLVATTEDEHIKGLSGRKEPLAKEEGMLFQYAPPRFVNYWMKETYIPLDAAYFSEESRLIAVNRMLVEADPSLPKHQYPSDAPTAYVIEAAPGTFDGIDPAAQDWRLCDGNGVLRIGAFNGPQGILAATRRIVPMGEKLP